MFMPAFFPELGSARIGLGGLVFCPRGITKWRRGALRDVGELGRERAREEQSVVRWASPRQDRRRADGD